MSEPKPRVNRIAQEKEELRATLTRYVDKVPEAVNAGSIQATRAWVKSNERLRRVVNGKRSSRFALRRSLESVKAWHE